MPITKLGQRGFLLKTRIAEIETFVRKIKLIRRSALNGNQFLILKFTTQTFCPLTI